MDLAGTADCTRTGVSPRFTAFVAAMTAVLDEARGDERHILHHGTPHVLELVAHDDWLPDHLAKPLPGAYGQYLLYRDPDVRFTAVAFVWDAGAGTPIHDHKVWGIVGALRGAELAERFELLPEGGLRSLGTALLRAERSTASRRGSATSIRCATRSAIARPSASTSTAATSRRSSATSTTAKPAASSPSFPNRTTTSCRCCKTRRRAARIAEGSVPGLPGNHVANRKEDDLIPRALGVATFATLLIAATAAAAPAKMNLPPTVDIAKVTCSDLTDANELDRAATW